MKRWSKEVGYSQEISGKIEYNVTGNILNNLEVTRVSSIKQLPVTFAYIGSKLQCAVLVRFAGRSRDGRAIGYRLICPYILVWLNYLYRL